MTREERANDYAEYNQGKYTSEFGNLYHAYLKGAEEETKELTDEIDELKAQLTKAKKLISSLLYVYQLGKNELALARVRAEAKEFLKEVSE